MIELGQLEKHHADFEKRNVRVVVSSVEGPEESKKTQSRFPHLQVLADDSHALSNAVDVMHKNSGPGLSDTSAPTTLIIDGSGIVRWTFRPDNVTTRLSPEEVLAQLDRTGK
jgi:peroxiredoxin